MKKMREMKQNYSMVSSVRRWFVYVAAAVAILIVIKNGARTLSHTPSSQNPQLLVRAHTYLIFHGTISYN